MKKDENIQIYKLRCKQNRHFKEIQRIGLLQIEFWCESWTKLHPTPTRKNSDPFLSSPMKCPMIGSRGVLPCWHHVASRRFVRNERVAWLDWDVIQILTSETMPCFSAAVFKPQIIWLKTKIWGGSNRLHVFRLVSVKLCGSRIKGQIQDANIGTFSSIGEAYHSLSVWMSALAFRDVLRGCFCLHQTGPWTMTDP